MSRKGTPLPAGASITWSPPRGGDDPTAAYTANLPDGSTSRDAGRRLAFLHAAYNLPIDPQSVYIGTTPDKQDPERFRRVQRANGHPDA